MTDPTRPDPALVQWVIRWILTAGEKPPKPDEQKPATKAEPKPGEPPSPLDALDAFMSTLDAEHAQALADARAAYVDLVTRVAPPRMGEAPADGVHALACAPPGPPPDHARVLEILRAVGKTPHALREDVTLFAAIRERADLVARVPALLDQEREFDRQYETLKAELIAIAAEYDVKLQAAQRSSRACWHERNRADEARRQLFWDQHVAAQIKVAARSIGRPPSTMYVPVPEQEARRAREKAACRAACEAVEAGAARLDYLERAFFPPPPPPAEAPEPETVATWLTNVAPPSKAKS